MDDFGAYVAGLTPDQHRFGVDFLRRVADELERKAAGLSREKWAAAKGCVVLLRKTANDMIDIQDMRAELMDADRPPIRVPSREMG
jgi:hypothetical protein